MLKKNHFPKSIKGKLLAGILFLLFSAILFLVLEMLGNGETRYYSGKTDTQVSRSVNHENGHITTAVQQIMIGTKCGNDEQATATLKALKDAGDEGIELNEFMIHKTPFIVKILTQLAGMPVGNGGKLDWPKLIENSGLKVVSLHCYLDAIEKDPKSIAEEAKCFGTDTVVITAMNRYDYSDLQQVEELAKRLNHAGEALSKYGIRLLYHNHNVEAQKRTKDKSVYDILIEETDSRYLNFELDSYWMADAGVDVPALMEKLGNRMKLWHITDRGSRKKGPYITPILKEDEMELGYGNMDLKTLAEIAKKNGVEGVILETHKNWVDKDPIKSLQKSADFMKTELIQSGK